MYSHYTLSYCVVLTNQSYLQHWTKVNKPWINRSVKWPTGRFGHAATCVSGPLLVIVGGRSSGQSAISDCWIHDLTTMKWKKVIIFCRSCVSDIVFARSLGVYFLLTNSRLDTFDSLSCQQTSVGGWA